MWFLFEVVLYLIVDNITKYFLLSNRRQTRFDILISESLLLGFLIGFLSVYYQWPYTLIGLLCIHIFGTLYTERRFNLIRRGIETFIRVLFGCFRLIFNRLRTLLSHRSPPKVLISKKLPQKYLYNYHLKPTNDLRLQQPSPVQTLPRPGIVNFHGTTCSLNALLQSLASLNTFYSTLQRNVNLSRVNYDSIVSTFLNLLSQLRNDYRTSNYEEWNTVVDTSSFISRISSMYPNLLSKHSTTDIAELFQCIIDVLSNALAKQISVCSTNVIEQVQNQKLTTFSLVYLNRIFLETEAQLHQNITLDNLDAQASYIVQYVDLTWLLHHTQLGSIIKNTFSGQLLHAHCCKNCSHVRFRTEAFQILPLMVENTNTTLERMISQLTKIEPVDSISCSYCSSQNPSDDRRESKVIKHGTLFTRIASTLSPTLTTRLQPLSSPPPPIIPSPATHHSSRVKSQTMIANFPTILCIQLKRFSFDRLSQTTQKLNTNISIEPDKILDLSHIHYTTWLGLATTIPSRYRLIAVCLHLSRSDRTNPMAGHYVCLYRPDHSRWFLSDDERITEINQIENIFHTPYVTENCYLLFYERC